MNTELEEDGEDTPRSSADDGNWRELEEESVGDGVEGGGVDEEEDGVGVTSRSVVVGWEAESTIEVW